MARVLCIGECMAELSAAEAGGYRLGFGGDTLNTALYMARLLGPDAVAYVTRLGDDPYSARMRAAWEAEGLDCTLVETVLGATVGLYAIDTDARGERSFTYWRAEAPARELFTRGNWHVRAEAMAAAELAYFSGITLAVMPDEGRDRLISAAGVARASGARVAFDPNLRPRLWVNDDAAPWIARAYRTADIALTSAAEERALVPDAAARPPWPHLAEAGVAEIVSREGARGAIAAADGAVAEVPAPSAAPALDTTGAGDAFNAAYLAARLNGLGPEQSAQLGCALGTRVAGHPGAIIPPDALADLMEELARARR